MLLWNGYEIQFANNFVNYFSVFIATKIKIKSAQNWKFSFDKKNIWITISKVIWSFGHGLTSYLWHEKLGWQGMARDKGVMIGGSGARILRWTKIPFNVFFFLGFQRNHGTTRNAEKEGRNIGVDAISKKKKKNKKK